MTDERESAKVQLGHIGSFGLRLAPVITLVPDIPRRQTTDLQAMKPSFLLTGTRTPRVELMGSCKNLSGHVPCTLAWIIERDVDKLATHDKKLAAAARFERDDPRNGKLWLMATVAGRYQVMIASTEWSPRSGTPRPSTLTFKPLDTIDVLALDLLGSGSLGYRLQPDCPVDGGQLLPGRGFRFDNAIEFATTSHARIGMEIQIMPIRYPDWLAHESLHLTIYNGDDSGDSWSFRDVKLGDRQSWWFGGYPRDTAQESRTTTGFAFHDHEVVAQLSYGARIAVIDTTGKKARIVTSLEMPNRWSGPVRILESFRLEPELEDE